MHRPAVLVLGTALAFMLVSDGRGAAVAGSTAVLVELFTSEGCSSCPPADELLQSLVDGQPVAGAEVIGLGQHVDYWDQLGWKDRFSSAALTNRQQQYAHAFNVEAIYTPQMIVDGREEFVGSDAKAARRAIGRAASSRHGVVAIAIEPAGAERVAVSVTATGLPAFSRGDRADVVLAVAESQLRSEVRGGENKGRVLTHAAVVRQLSVVGEATANQASARSDLTIAPAWQRAHLSVVAFVQERASRRILAAGVTALR